MYNRWEDNVTGVGILIMAIILIAGIVYGFSVPEYRSTMQLLLYGAAAVGLLAIVLFVIGAGRLNEGSDKLPEEEVARMSSKGR